LKLFLYLQKQHQKDSKNAKMLVISYNVA